MQGHLRARSINVQRSRTRAVIRDVDPQGVRARQRLRIRCHVYSVPCPNYLWHVDGNHKLIRWGFVLHHGIDGFSRLVTFGKFSTNNRAATVLQVFRRGVSKGMVIQLKYALIMVARMLKFGGIWLKPMEKTRIQPL